MDVQHFISFPDHLTECCVSWRASRSQKAFILVSVTSKLIVHTHIITARLVLS